MMKLLLMNTDSEVDNAERYSTLSNYFSPPKTSSTIVKYNKSKLQQQPQQQRKAQWSQVTTMPTVSCPKSGHNTHLFHH